MHLRAAPHRCTPILGLVLNDEMGWMKDEQGQHNTVGDAVGSQFGRAEAYAGTKFREMLEIDGMAA
eukprot:9883758-Heterocapsa_arctica.AAC.1